MQRSYLLVSAFYLTLVFSFISIDVKAQNVDSLKIVQKSWTEKKIKKGVVWRQGHFQDLFKSNQEINWIEINLNQNRKKLHLAANPKKLQITSSLAEENDAILAINGGFFDIKNGGAVDFVKVNNEVINQTREPSDRANAVFSIGVKKVKIQKSRSENLELSNDKDILLSGPLLLESHTRTTLKKNPFNNNRHPRTAIGITKNNKLILLVVDGRNANAQGMNLHELTSVLKWIGASDAMNLDGGGSSTMFIKDANDNHIVNYPSDNKKFDHQGQRKVANIIYLKN